MLSRRSFLAAQAGACFAQGQRRPPNVLFIAADDMNTALGCYGHPVVKTPHLDRLASRGVLFQRAYCQFPLCGPTRASLLTGLRPDTTRVLGNNIDFRDHLPEAVTLPQLFRKHGFTAAREGKMFHMNVPGEVGSNRFQDAASWDHNVSPPGLEGKSEGQRLRISEGSGSIVRIATADSKGQADDNAASNAIALLEKHRADPFFMAVGFVRPHLPFVAPSRFFDMYPASRVPAPENPAGDLDDVPEAHKRVRPYLWNHMGMSREMQIEARRSYYAATSFMDEQVGRVLDALEGLRLVENTIVVFWGDHGWDLGEHTHWHKMSLFENSARVPLLVSAPGRRRGVCRALVEYVDVYPTLASLCGLPVGAHLEGQSLVPLLSDPGRRQFKKAAFTQLAFEKIEGRSVRTERYRYTRWNGDGPNEELYDHSSDPGEFTNLASRPEHRRVLEEHRKILTEGWRASRAT